MRRRLHCYTALVCVSVTSGLLLFANGYAAEDTSDRNNKIMNKHATGTFDVKLKPQANDPESDTAFLARMSLDKQFHGDLERTSKGEMLAARTAAEGSADYVAIEQVTGTLHGRRGTSFCSIAAR